MIVRLPLLVRIACCFIGMLIISPAMAQSSGLKLGQPEPSNTVDLSAADKEAPPPTPAATQGAATRTQYGDWDVACDLQGVNCVMAQVGSDSAGTPVLEMIIKKLEQPLEVGERTAIAVLDVITPLGVVLTEGLAIAIDNGRNELAPFQICTEQGCLVREPIDDDLITRFKRGNKATVTVIAANQGEVKSVISLKGFTKSYDSLK